MKLSSCYSSADFVFFLQYCSCFTLHNHLGKKKNLPDFLPLQGYTVKVTHLFSSVFFQVLIMVLASGVFYYHMKKLLSICGYMKGGGWRGCSAYLECSCCYMFPVIFPSPALGNYDVKNKGLVYKFKVYNLKNLKERLLERKCYRT